MHKTRRSASAFAMVSVIAFGWAAGCLSSSGGPGGTSGGGSPDGGTGVDATSSGTGDSSTAKADGRASSDGGAGEAASYTYVLIDDMETTTHGPIELAGINPPLTPGYWFNFGASVCGDTATPPMMSFEFTALPTPTTTYDGKMSMHAAHQECGLNGQYDVCGLGFEFAQVTDYDAGSPAAAATTECDASPENPSSPGDAASPEDAASPGDAASPKDAALPKDAGSQSDADPPEDANSPKDAASPEDAASVSDATSEGDAGLDGGDSGPPIPKVTVPFDISQYKGITFWAKATVTGDAGALSVKVQFPDTDTDPRGGVCNSGAAFAAGPQDTSQCYNSYAIQMEMVTGEWQQFTVLFTDLMISPDFGYQDPSPFVSTDGGPSGNKQVYGINWQAQRNDLPNGIPEIEDFWVDDVYFIK
jgi:hypothetical protein